MLIASAKLADIAARSLFVLLVLYSLPVRSTGQFGLILTLIGFFTFLAGFERYADLQRRMVGANEQDTDRLIVSTLRFYALNYSIWLPVLLVLLVVWVQLPMTDALICGVIALGEHLSNEVYRIALIAPRHRPVLFAVLAKNLITLAAVAALLWRRAAVFDIGTVLIVWGCVSFIGLIAIAIGFTKTWAFDSFAAAGGAKLGQMQQYCASRVHFMIGLVALAALQIDRLVVGSLLPLEQSGLYFRHVFLASFVYQLFNVVSYNRVSARVYAQARAGAPMLARRTIRREMKILVPVTVVLAFLSWNLDVSLLPPKPAIQTLRPPYLAILLLAFLVRAIADYNALLLNAVYREQGILIAQSIALFLSLALYVVLTHAFGIAGTVCTLLLGSGIYLIGSGVYARRSPELKIAS